MAYIGPEPNPGQNREVDDISSSFNGSTTAFTLQVNSQNVSPGSANAIIVSLGGVVQNPGTDYTIAASTLTFTTAPASGLSFFGLVLGQQIDTEGTADGTITLAKFVNGTSSNNGKFLRANNGAIPSFETITGTTINNNADNRIITGSGTANTLEGESNATFDGTKFSLTPPKNSNNDGFEVIPAGGTTASFFKVLGNNNAGADGRNGGVVNIDANYYAEASTIFSIAARGTTKFSQLGNGTVQIDGGASGGGDTQQLKFFDTGDVLHLRTAGTNAANHGMIQFRDGNSTYCGQITSHGTNHTTSYVTNSDYRLKENEVLISDGIIRLKQLKPYRFKWKTSGNEVDGFFAHETQTVVPESIVGTKDETEDILYVAEDTIPEGKSIGDVKETVPKYQGIDQAKLVPLLTAALQEAVTKIETLETKVAALEAA